MADSICYDNSPLGVFHMTEEYSIPQGANWDTSLIYKENGNAIDFSSGYTAKLQVRKDYGQAIIIELNSAAGTIVLASGAVNTPNVVLKWTPAATTPLSIYEGIYDLEITSPTGSIIKFLEGKWALRREVTL